jgi:hypothetical protein
MKVENATSTTPPVPEYEKERISDLYLDPKNPRLLQYGIRPKATQKEILRALWERLAVDEVAMSIAADGYWGFEPLFVVREKVVVTPEGENPDKVAKPKEETVDVVIEGNRRLAAVKLLLDADLRRSLAAVDLPVATEDRREGLKELPIIRVKNREDVWRFLGFKHVNGPAKWGSHAKAQYIAFVHKTTGESLESIAAQIGDKHRTVQRLYRALMVIEQAERANVYKRDYAYKNQLSFSHLMTALDYEGFRSFLKLANKESETENPVNQSRLKQLGEVCIWLWGDNRDKTPPLIKTQNPNLRQLDRVLANSQAVATLRLGQGLEAAYEVSKGDDIVFSEALQDAKNSLVKAQGRVSSGYKGEPHLLDLALTVAGMADDLVHTMERKSSSGRRRKDPEANVSQ